MSRVAPCAVGETEELDYSIELSIGTQPAHLSAPAVHSLLRHPSLIEARTSFTPIGHHAREQGVKAFAMVMFDEVAKFVHNDIVN